MGLFDRSLKLARSALLGISAYQPPDDDPRFFGSIDLDSPEAEAARRNFGGNIASPSLSRTRWYMADLEAAEHAANNGRLSLVGQLMSAARRDGVLSGVLSTRTDGLVRLPRRFRGDPEVVKALEPTHEADGSTTASVRSVFDEMLPPAELALLAADGILCGVGVAELVKVEGRDYPVLVRLDPQFLEYQWTENRWYYRSIIGRLPITPGDGRWVLHIPGGRIAPWQGALWRCIGRAYVRKEHALLHKDAWEAKLAHPARVAYAPQAATELQSQSHFRNVMAWGVNTVFGLRPGYEVKLLESNGRGFESFNKTIEHSDKEFVISIAGQEVTVDGGSGFINSDLFKTIRSDLIQASGDSLALTINTQALPVFVALRWGADAVLRKSVAMEWDVTPPKDRNSEATSLVSAAAAIKGLDDSLARHGLELDVSQVCLRFAIPVSKPKPVEPAAEGGTPKLTLLQGGKSDGGVETAPAVPALPGDTQAQDTALNGAQVASLMQIVIAVAKGELPRDAAIGIIKRAFLVDDEGAAEMLGSAGAGFTPTPEPEAAPAPAPAADPQPAAPDEAA